MFKNPMSVDVNAKDVTVTHRIEIDIESLAATARHASEFVVTVAICAVTVTFANAAAKTLQHAAKTKIK